MGCSLPGSSVHWILQARILDWVALSSCRGSSRPRDQTDISCGSWVAGRSFTTEPPRKPSKPKALNMLILLHHHISYLQDEPGSLFRTRVGSPCPRHPPGALAPVPADVQHQSGDLRSIESIWHSTCHSWCSTPAGVRAGVPHTRERELAFHTRGSESWPSTPAGVRAEAGAAAAPCCPGLWGPILHADPRQVTDSSSWVSPFKDLLSKDHRD